MDSLVGSLAGLCSIAEAVGAAVVGGSQRSAVVVSKLDDDPVAGLDEASNGIETSLAGVRASAASANGTVVDYGLAGREGVLEVRAPSLGACAASGLGRGAVAAEVDRRNSLALLNGLGVGGQSRGQAEEAGHNSKVRTHDFGDREGLGEERVTINSGEGCWKNE